jgi:hypothetical protein
VCTTARLAKSALRFLVRPRVHLRRAQLAPSWDLLPEYALRGRFAKCLPPGLLRGSDASPFVRWRAFRQVAQLATGSVAGRTAPAGTPAAAQKAVQPSCSSRHLEGILLNDLGRRSPQGITGNSVRRHSLQVRSCPRNCKRRGCSRRHWERNAPGRRAARAPRARRPTAGLSPIQAGRGAPVEVGP